MLKLSENPPIIWPEEMSIADFEGNWWVAHTKSRNEKALANQLVNSHVPYFLPMHWKVSKSRGRTIRSLLPLFPGYLFFCGGEDQRLDVPRAAAVEPQEQEPDSDRAAGQQQRPADEEEDPHRLVHRIGTRHGSARVAEIVDHGRREP